MKKATAQATAAAQAQTTQAAQAEQTATVKTFADLLTDYETAYTNGNDYTNELYALATAAAQSVVKKCIDPQRKAATTRETVSNSGHNAALVAVRRGIVGDFATLDNLTAAHNAAYEWKFNKDGYIISEVVDKAAEKAATALQGETLSDGIDLVQSAVVAILEQSADHATAAPGWMETPYTVRRISRKVVIKSEDSAKWEDVETSPIREVYRYIRREVQNSRAMQTDPRNGYLYIEDTAADPDSTQLETIYRRLNKWADLGGYTHDGHYTADAQTVADYESTIAALNLSDRQATVIKLRMSGYGYKAIGTYMGIDHSNVIRICKQIQNKAEKVGFTPSMWAHMTAE